MSTKRSNNGDDNGHDDDDDIISSSDIDKAALNAFKRGTNAFNNAEIGKDKKFLGLITMDAGIVDMLDGIYNVGAEFLSNTVRPKLYELVEGKAPPKILGLSSQKVAAVASIGTAVALKTSGYFVPIWNGLSEQRNELRDLTHTLAPVLDDIKGNHSLVALYTTGIKDNEVIYAHRKRLGKIAQSANLSNVTELFVSSGTSLVLDIKSFAHDWKGRPKIEKPQVPAAPAAHPGQHETALYALKAGGIGMLPQLAKRISATSEFKLKKELQPYSALEMIEELAEQVSSNSKARGFTVPRSFQSPHGRREQYSLEEYLMRICIQHQKDMAYLEPQYTEIREALRDDLAATVKPLAEAIRKGEFNVMGLVRLVGEGKIIKKQGRAIATAADISALLEKEEPKQAAYAPVDPNTYYKDSPFSRSQMKAALKELNGEERITFCSMFPDTILIDAGMTKDDVKTMRHDTAASYDHTLAEGIIGLNEKSDDQLKLKGMAHSEIKQIRDAATAIHEQGDAAMHALKTSAVNEHGIEHLLANITVQQPQYLGKLIEEGHAILQQPSANDPDYHAGRETRRRSNGTHAAQTNIS